MLTTVHSFDLTDGDNPYAALLQATDGNLYGSTAGGGTSDWGTVFKLDAGLKGIPPSILSFFPRFGRVRTVVVINGKNLEGATSVTFDGVNAKRFTVESSTQIRATVPEGAKTGKIGVTTPGGTATSEGTFRVF